MRLSKIHMIRWALEAVDSVRRCSQDVQNHEVYIKDMQKLDERKWYIALVLCASRRPVGL